MEEKKIRRQDKWAEKTGIKPRSYQLDIAVDSEFRKVCDELGVKYGPTITGLMKEFIRQSDKVNKGNL